MSRPVQRRGSIYLAVMATALIVSLLGLSALALQRLQRRSFEQTEDEAQARLNAETAIAIGMERVRSDAQWRAHHSSGVWENNVPLAAGDCTLEGIDPADGNLANSSNDPLLLIGTGRRGTAVHRIERMLVPRNDMPIGPDTALLAAKTLEFNGASVYCSHTLRTNDQATASNASINADVAATGRINGSTFRRKTTSGVAPVPLPDAAALIGNYRSQGTAIDINTLPTGFSNLLVNPAVEDAALNGWIAAPGPDPTCTIARDATTAHGGGASLRVSSRAGIAAGPAQHVLGVLQKGVSYDFSAWARLSSGEADVQLVLYLESTGDGEQWLVAGRQRVGTAWTQLSTTFQPNWTGQLLTAYAKVCTPVSLADFYVDDATFRESGGDRTIYRETLTPNRNPFGSRATNSRGIYVLDCGGANLRIKCGRILGTLVVLNAGSNSTLGGGPLAWSAAEPGLPALVTDSPLTIAPTATALCESAWRANFNPTGSPAPGIGEDEAMDDALPSEIQGWIYSSKAITFRKHPVLRGFIVGGDKITVEGEMDLFFQPPSSSSPPAGLTTGTTLRVLRP